MINKIYNYNIFLIQMSKDSTIESYDNLDYLLEIYYDFIYKSNPNSKYVMKPINRSEIKLIDLKKPKDYNYDHILNDKVKFDRHLNQRLVFIRKSKNYSCHLSFGYFDSNCSDNMNTGVLYNMAMMYMGSELVSNEKFRHIILPVMLFEVDYAKINLAVPNFKDLEKKYMKHRDNKKMFCMVTENYFNMIALDEFIYKNHKDFTSDDYSVLLFQIIFYLYKMQQRFKMFRHNNFNMKSIRVYTRKPSDKKISYKVNNKLFLIPDRGFDIKVGDYDFSNTTDYLTNSKASTEKNMYFDLYVIMNYLYMFIKKHKMKVPIDIIKFMDEIVPRDIRVDDKKNLNIKTIIPPQYKDMNFNRTSPIMILLKNTFFDKYLKDNMSDDENTVSLINSPEMTVSQSITDLSDEPKFIARR